jgi:hypothetical protein
MDPQFTWLSLVDTLASGDVTKYEQVYDVSYELCLSKLSYDHAKDKYTREVNRRIELQNRARR